MLVSSSPIRVIIAVRVSSEEQKERGYGHANQMRRLPELVAEQGWELARRPDGRKAIYDEEDASTTAATGHDLSLDTRPVLKELLAELPQVQPTYLVCRALDRLHRSRLEWELLCGQLAKAGVAGIAQFPQLSGPPTITRLENIHDQTLAALQAAFAQLQKAELKVHLMNGRRERAHRGLPNGGRVPYGYSRPVKGGPFVVVMDEAAVYGQLIEWAVSGWGPAKMAKALNDRSTPTRNGATGWSATTVRRILESKAQLGMVRTWDGWVPGEGMPAITEQDRWEMAHASLAERKRGNGGTNTKRNALAGILRCSACGKTLKAYTNRPKRKGGADGERYAYKHYTCKIYNSGCSAGHSISERRALNELADHVDRRLKATQSWQNVQPDTPDPGPLKDRVSELAKQRAKAEKDMKRAYEAYVDAEDDLRSVAAQTLNERKERLRAVRAQLEAAQRSMRRYRQRLLRCLST